MTALPVLLAMLTPYLSYRQHISKHSVTLQEMLSVKMIKARPAPVRLNPVSPDCTG